MNVFSTLWGSVTRGTLNGAVSVALTLTALSVQAADDATIKRGEYLARAADCVACHLDENGGKPYAGGRGFKLPFGMLYSPNITPDNETGIGTWSDDDFVNAMQKGVGKDGKHYYPAFPYTSYTLMSRDDILAIKAYLFSLPPVKQPNKENDISFPFNQRWGMMFWNFLFNPNERFQPDPSQSAEWNRGAYLVEGAGHCGECHTPRNLFQARDSSRNLGGAVIQGWKAYNISGDKATGIGAWPDEALASYLSTGHAEGYGVAAGPMAEAVNHSLRHLTPEDIRAMVVYLKSVPAQTYGLARPEPKMLSPEPPAKGNNPLGQKTFADACVSCHLWDGTGRQSTFAALKGLRTVNDPEATNLVQVLLGGGKLENPHGDHFMPGFARAYSDQELAAVTNFVLDHFGHAKGMITAEEIAKRRNPE